MKTRTFSIDVKIFDETDEKTLENLLNYAFDEAGINGISFVKEVLPVEMYGDFPEAPRVVQSMDALRDYFEEKGWKVVPSEDVPIWQVGLPSPKSEGFWLALRHDNDVQKAIETIKEYAYAFADFDSKGVRDGAATKKSDGSPSNLDRLRDLADGMTFYDQKSIIDTLAAAEVRSDEKRLKFVDNRMQSVLSGDAKDDPGFDEYDLV